MLVSGSSSPEMGKCTHTNETEAQQLEFLLELQAHGLVRSLLWLQGLERASPVCGDNLTFCEPNPLIYMAHGLHLRREATGLPRGRSG